MQTRERPLWIWIDAAATCNLACKLCYTAPMRSKSLMPLAVFDTVLARLHATSARVIKLHLNWRGEPTSNPRLSDMLARLADVDWDVEWHTNATLITPRRADGIVNANPKQRIWVSLDGGNAPSFEENRGAGMWSKALAGAEALILARGRRRRPEIGIYQLDLGVPNDEYDGRFVALTKRVDQHVVERPVDLDGGSLQPTLGHSPIPRGPCFWVGNTLAIDVQGQAWTCLLRKGTRLGSLLEQEADELLQQAVSMRTTIEREGRTAIPGCATCRKKEGSAKLVGGEPGEIPVPLS